MPVAGSAQLENPAPPTEQKKLERRELSTEFMREIKKNDAPEVQPVSAEQIITRAISNLLSSSIIKRHQAEKTLVEYGIQAIPYLIKAFRRPEFELHLAVTSVAIKIGPQGEEAFLEMLEDKEIDSRWHAAKILGNVGTAHSVYPLMRALDDPVVCPTAVDALGMLGDKRAIPVLKELLNSEDEFIKMLTSRALKKLGVRTEQPMLKYVEGP